MAFLTAGGMPTASPVHRGEVRGHAASRLDCLTRRQVVCDLSNVQPGRQPAGRRQRGQDRATVGRDGPGPARAGGHAADWPTGYIYGVAFSADRKTLAAAVTDGTLWLRNVTAPAHPNVLATLTGPNGHVYSVDFAPAGSEPAAASSDGTIRLWETSPAADALAVSRAGAVLPQPVSAIVAAANAGDVSYMSLIARLVT